MRTRLSVLLLLSLVIACPVHAARRAVVVVGIAVDDLQSHRLQQAASLTREALIARGVPAGSIITLGAPASARAKRDQILAALAPGADAAPDDETWIVLFGSASMRGDQPAFQISGPRLSAADLTGAVAALPGRKFVVVASSASGAFLPPLLSLPDVEAVAATGDTGEINEPRFIEIWPQVLAEMPAASFSEVALKTDQLIREFYEQTQLAVAEHARLIDRASGTIIRSPFAKQALAGVAKPSTERRPEQGYSAADIEIPKPADGLDIQRLPADEASRALVAEAVAAAAGSPHAALILRSETAVVVGASRDAKETFSTRTYIRTGEALDEVATIRLPGSFGGTLSRLTGARVVKPDGSQLLVNLPSLAETARKDIETDNDANRDAPPAPPFVELPEVTPGCVVEVAWTVETKARDSLPAFYDEWHLARGFPVLSARIAITHPAAENWRTFAPNLPEPARTGDDTSRTVAWDLTDLAAREPLPGDPPAREFTPWIGLSSLENWDAFAAWYRGLAAGSETADSKVEALADEIAAAHPTRLDRIRVAYERVAALRYVAIELGVGAFRPRTPGKVWAQHYGDCKDKANLLVALLRRMGIEAEFVLVNRFDATFTEFPGWQFNHAIARVPAAPAEGQPHALWLDSTDRLVPFGIIAPGDLGRQGLVFSRGFEKAEFHEITAEQEPRAEWLEQYTFNRAEERWELNISAKGAAEAMLRRNMADQPPRIRAERIRQQLGLTAANIDKIQLPDPYDLATPFVLHVTFGRGLTADAFSRFTPRTLAPGLSAYAHRFLNAPADSPLIWNDGRDWLFRHAHEDSEEQIHVPGRRTPATFAGFIFGY